MIGQRYTRSTFDNCVYFLRLHDGYFIYLLLYVDDMMTALKNVEEIEKLKTRLNQEFEMKDLGETKKILGMEITRDREGGKICLTQKQYLKKVCFNISENSKHVSTPLFPHMKLSASLSPSLGEERECMS